MNQRLRATDKITIQSSTNKASEMDQPPKPQLIT